jgi:hypothetical protein
VHVSVGRWYSLPYFFFGCMRVKKLKPRVSEMALVFYKFGVNGIFLCGSFFPFAVG